MKNGPRYICLCYSFSNGSFEMLQFFELESFEMLQFFELEKSVSDFQTFEYYKNSNLGNRAEILSKHRI